MTTLSMLVLEYIQQHWAVFCSEMGKHVGPVTKLCVTIKQTHNGAFAGEGSPLQPPTSAHQTTKADGATRLDNTLTWPCLPSFVLLALGMKALFPSYSKSKLSIDLNFTIFFMCPISVLDIMYVQGRSLL